MTKYLYLIPILLILAGLTQSPIIAEQQTDWQWSIPEVVSTESTSYSATSLVEVDSTGNIHVVWYDNTDYDSSGLDGDVFYKKWDSGTQIWGLTEVISADLTGSSSNPSFVIDSLDNIHVVWNDDSDYNSAGTDYDIFYRKYDSTTLTWNAIEIVSTDFSGTSGKPKITSDNMNNLHLVWRDDTDYDGSGTDYDVIYKHWDATTQVWSNEEVVSTESTELSSAASITIGKLGDVHIVWEDNTDYDDAGTDRDIFYKKWDQTAQAWTSTEVVSTESTTFSEYPEISSDNAGNIHVIWRDFTDYDGAGNDHDIFYKKWDLISQKWSLTDVISTESTSTSTGPSFVIDSFDNIHVVWSEVTNYNGAGTDYDIFYKKHTPDESNWGTISNVVSINSGDSHYPSLCLDKSQFLHLVWQDTTNYSASGTDSDILYLRFSGLAQAPVLQGILPNPSDGVVNLEWDEVLSAASYSVYRDVYPIYSTDGLTAIAETGNSYYVDEPGSGGTFYYAITANNPEGSVLSNTVYVQVEIVVETVTETYTTTINDILTEMITEISTDTNGGFVDYPMSIPLLFGSITLIIIIQRRKRAN